MRTLITLLSIFTFFTISVNAQDSSNADGLIQLARKAAFDEKNAEKAKSYLHTALKLSPDYADVKVFLGRLHAWDKNYDSARYYLNSALSRSTSEDAYVAAADVEYWTDNYTTALSIIQKGLETHPRSEELLLRKAKVENAQSHYSQAEKTLEQLLKINGKNTEARALAERVNQNSAENSIGVSYDYVHFEKQFTDPWHLLSFDYGRKTKFGSIIGRVNYANRFQKSGFQYELDAYPKISKTFYSYINVGYSEASIFPQWRAGFSLYANLPSGFEAEGGFRYLYFGDPTFIYTAALGKYYKNFLFNVRTYLTPSDGELSQSYNVSARYYFGGATDYFGLTLGTGISPDDRSLVNQLPTIAKLKSHKAGIVFKKSINSYNVFTINASLNNQEYVAGKKDNQVQAGIAYQLRF
jgi:YaiO family outer membrane protein